MSAFLVVVPPLAGHVNPLVCLSAELGARGHLISWVGHRELIGRLLPADSDLVDVPVDRSAHERLGAGRERFVRGPDSVRFFFEEGVTPLARQMAPVVARAIEDRDPDALIVDQHALGGAFAARHAGRVWITSSPTSALYPAGTRERLPELHEWMSERLHSLEEDAGLPPTKRPDVSSHLVLVHTSRRFAGDDASSPAHFRFHGPLIGGRPSGPRFDGAMLGDARPRVLVTLGSMTWAHARRFHRAAADAAIELGGRMIIDAPSEHVEDAPTGVTVTPDLPILDVIRHMDAVVCHAGSNTVHEALDQGLPLVVAPVRDDQPVFAERVVATGSGVRVKFARASSSTLVDALRAVLGDASYRRAAESLRESFRQAGGVAAAADSVLATSRAPATGEAIEAR